jgi:hypothetical protein
MITLALFLTSTASKYNIVKQLLTATALLLCTFSATAQEKKEIAIRFTYNGSPLCNWEVTLKHGDVQLAKTTSDNNGYARFPEATILSKSVDAYGYKAHQNGDKKWDVKGYITLDDNYQAAFDFKDVMKEMEGSGMPKSMLEASWGLTMNDCGGVASSSGESGQSTPKPDPNGPKNTFESGGNGTGGADVNSPVEMAKQRKQGYENEVAMFDRKIPKLEEEIASAQSAGTDTRLLEADLKEMRAKREHRLAAIKVADAEIAGGKPDAATVAEERSKKDALEAAKDERKAIEKELKGKGKSTPETESNSGGSTEAGEDDKKMSPAAARIKLQKLKAELKLKQSSLKKEEKSGKYNQEYLDGKRAEIKAIESEISRIQASLGSGK